MTDRRGAYGICVPQLGQSELLGDGSDSWPDWSFEWSDEPAPTVYEWSDTRAVLPLRPQGTATVLNNDLRTIFRDAEHRSDDALAHPMMGTTAVAAAAWRGDFSLHAGVIAPGGRAWGLLGARGAGKSSALGWSATNDIPVVADDLLVTDGQVVLAGPRFIDLRAGAAEHFDLGTDVGILGSRRRWRVPVKPVAPSVPLAGWIELAWGSQISLEPIDLNDRVERLGLHRALQLPLDDSRSALAVITKPAYRFTRPQSWERVDEAMTKLVDQLTSTSPAR